MNYISPIQYSQVLNTFRGINEEYEEETIEVPEIPNPDQQSPLGGRGRVSELMANLSPEDREQLKEYADSLVEIKKEIRKILTKAKSGGNSMDEIGGDMMHKRLDITS